MDPATWLLSVGTVGAIFAITSCMTTNTASAQTFHGYPCTEDCSGHEAGYNWAEQHGIEDPGDCDGNSDSFVEGCQAYAAEHREGLQEEETDSPDNEATLDDANEDAVDE